MIEELTQPVSDESPDGQVDSQEEFEEFDAEETEEDTELDSDAEVEDDGETDDQEDTAPDPAIQAMQDTIAQQAEQLQQMNAYLQQMQSQQRQKPQQRPQQVPIPSDYEEWEPTQQAQWSAQAGQHYAQQIASKTVDPVMRRLAVSEQLLQIMIEGRDDRDDILGALQEIQGQPKALSFGEAYKMRVGQKATKSLTKAEKRLQKHNQETRKRRKKAQGQQKRPAAASTKKGKHLSLEEVFAQAAKETGTEELL